MTALRPFQTLLVAAAAVAAGVLSWKFAGPDTPPPVVVMAPAEASGFAKAAPPPPPRHADPAPLRAPSWTDSLAARWSAQPDRFFLEQCVKAWTWEELLIALQTPDEAFQADGLARVLKPIVFRTMTGLDPLRAAEVALEIASRDSETARAYVGPVLEALAAYHAKAIPGWLDRLPSDGLEAEALHHLAREGTPELLAEMATRAAALDAGEPGVEEAMIAIEIRWADTDPSALAAWLLNYRADSDQRRAELQMLIERWAPADPAAMAEWIVGLQNAALRSDVAQMAIAWTERWVQTGEAAGSDTEANAARPLFQRLGAVVLPAR